mgnify:CR=1 FL=1|tara:strand:+ start:59 stop:547 length:489 start_codon:yes stop_codon:yes gene_type:complete
MASFKKSALELLLSAMMKEGDTPLFHVAPLNKLKRILDEDQLKSSRGPHISLSRDKNYPGWNENMNTQLILSKESLKHNNSMTPYEMPRYPRLADEREEQLQGSTLPDLSKHLRGINQLGKSPSLFDESGIYASDPETKERLLRKILEEINPSVPTFYKGGR